MSEYTPLPWKVQGSRYVTTDGYPGMLIADCYADTYLSFGLPAKNEARANAKLIVQACNCHEDLVGLAKRCLDVISVANMWPRLQHDLYEALAKAKT